MERIKDLLKKKMWEVGAMGSETVTIETNITEEEKRSLTGEESFFWELKNGVLIASACEDDLINNMLVNNVDNEIKFENLEEAKKFLAPSKSKEFMDELKKDFLGNDFQAYWESYLEYATAIENSCSLEELCLILNENTDKFSDGRTWEIS